MSEIATFDFDGLDDSALVIDAAHGPCIQSERLIRWLGWARPSDVRRDHLQPGDEVEISTSIKRGRGVAQLKVKHLTKRGVRRLLFRSNLPRAVDYADRVLDMLDSLDRDGMVIDEQRITEGQIAVGRERLAELARRRLEERMDYKAILHSLKLGGAVSEEYRDVQNTLYRSLFGMTAAQIRATQPQTGGVPRKRGGGWRKSTVAKDFMTADQLALLKSTVLATIAQVELRHPNGASAHQMVEAIHRAVALLQISPARRAA